MSADKAYLSLPLRELLNDAAAKSPTPGGGSVAAWWGPWPARSPGVAGVHHRKPAFAEHEPQLTQSSPTSPGRASSSRD